MMPKESALLLIDLQNDFCAGGSLAVKEGDAVIPVANELMKSFYTVIATQDWHPKNHSSFKTLWPAHCVQNTTGAAFHPDLDLSRITKIIQKGTDSDIDSYSAFYDNAHLKNTGLTQWLHDEKITSLTIMGLATDYCVKYSCIDAIEDGFTVTLVKKGCRGVNVKPNDAENALHELIEKGCLMA